MKLDLKAIEERCEKATSGPWTLSLSCQNVRFIGPRGEWIPIIKAREECVEDCIFIAHARDDIPDLLAFAKDAKEVLEYMISDIARDNQDYQKEANKVLEKHFGKDEG